MKILVVLNSNDAETAWNAFRFGVEALNKNHAASVFLLGKGVECENIKSKKFNIQQMLASFKKKNGLVLACGTCLKTRGKKESKICFISTMEELLQLAEDSDKILTF